MTDTPPEPRRSATLSTGSRTLQPALPKHDVRRPRRTSQHERDRVLFDSWFCVGRIDDLGLDRPGRLAVLDVVGESILVTSGPGRRAPRGVQRLSPPRLAGRPDRSRDDSRRPCDVGALRCPYHSWTYDLDGRLLKAPHTEGVDDFDPSGVRAARRSASATWGGFVFVHLTPDTRSRLRRRDGRVRRAARRATRWTRLADRADASPTTSPPTTRCSPRTTTSATTAGPSTPS